ncbi:hypothetical protein RND71_039678 [Anisodus tanguticus]|uniref:Uncharacterized protein n=1 Tax=Anisodus tanguticus TaxID=243964 RepID=A0AAE1R013_9SOLA|nr:hypothetical protein RND71_039678 [Anisodus tanguticus]
MTETVKRLNHTKEILQIQNTHLLEKITKLELRLRQTQSSPSPLKMDETGVHSLLNANRSIVPDVGTTSPAQTVTGKDSSNPLRAVTLPKKLRRRSKTQNEENVHGEGTIPIQDEEAMKTAIEGMNDQDLDGRNMTMNEAQSCGGGGGGSECI